MVQNKFHHLIRSEQPSRLIAVAIVAIAGFLVVFALTKDRSFYYATGATQVVGTVMYLHSLSWQHRTKPRSK